MVIRRANLVAFLFKTGANSIESYPEPDKTSFLGSQKLDTPPFAGSFELQQPAEPSSP